MIHDEIEFQPQDRVICAVPVLPAYLHFPQYVGVLQWCDGPNVQPIAGELPSLAFNIEKKFGNNKTQTYHFRVLKWQLSLLDCTKKNGDAAVLKAFTQLCANPAILKTIGTPFADELDDPSSRQAIVDFIVSHFNVLHETNKQ